MVLRSSKQKLFYIWHRYLCHQLRTMDFVSDDFDSGTFALPAHRLILQYIMVFRYMYDIVFQNP